MKPHARLACVALLATAALALTISCSTTSGSAYSSGVSGSGSAAERSAKDAEERARAARAARPVHPEPSRPDPLPPVSGRWHDDDNDDDASGLFLFFGQLVAAPALPTGTLLVQSLPPGANLYIDGEYRAGRSFGLAVGAHGILVTRFGFRDFSATATVYEGATTELAVESVPVPFAVESLEAAPASFDPADPGSYGSCRISLHAAAPGSAQVDVLDATGRIVLRLGERIVNQPYVSFRWNGRDKDGYALPPGSYILRASGSNAGSGSAETVVTLAPGSHARSSSLYSGVSGALLAPDARALGAGEAESAVGSLAIVLAPESSLPGRIVTHGGFRVGLGSGEAESGAFELDLSGLLALYPEQWDAANPIDSGSITAALKYVALSGPLSAAFYVKATYDSFLASGTWPSDWDGATRYAGLSAGLPLEGASGPVRLFVTPELIVSTFYPGYDDNRWEVPGLFAWGYLRVGFEATAGSVSLALSAALRSEVFGTSLGLRLPIAAGAELSWYSPGSPFVLSLVASGEITGPESYYFMGGLCAGFKY